MKRVVLLGRGGAGKSTLGRELSQLTGLPVIELDGHFWQPGLQPTEPEAWIRVQDELAQSDQWIMDGDLGPYDQLWVRLRRADTVIVLDFPFHICAWRALRRSRETMDFWWWLLTWRRVSRPKLMESLRVHAKDADISVIGSPAALRVFLREAAAGLSADALSVRRPAP